MKLTLLGRKRGMIQLFDESGIARPCTVIQAEPHVISQLKTDEVDGYTAVQLACEKIGGTDQRWKKRRASKPTVGHFKKIGAAPRRHLIETRLETTEGLEAGKEIGVELYANVTFVDVSARSKGKGFQGVMKKYNYSGGRATHGSGFHRHAGSIGMRSTPGRVFAGKPQASHMGDCNVTVQNLRVIKVDPVEQVIIVEGAVPGAVGALVKVRPALKKQSVTA